MVRFVNTPNESNRTRTTNAFSVCPGPVELVIPCIVLISQPIPDRRRDWSGAQTNRLIDRICHYDSCPAPSDSSQNLTSSLPRRKYDGSEDMQASFQLMAAQDGRSTVSAKYFVMRYEM